MLALHGGGYNRILCLVLYAQYMVICALSTTEDFHSEVNGDVNVVSHTVDKYFS